MVHLSLKPHLFELVIITRNNGIAFKAISLFPNSSTSDQSPPPEYGGSTFNRSECEMPLA
jgi:hypothetical protein